MNRRSFLFCLGLSATAIAVDPVKVIGNIIRTRPNKLVKQKKSGKSGPYGSSGVSGKSGSIGSIGIRGQTGLPVVMGKAGPKLR